jgi:hypothetical protein
MQRAILLIARPPLLALMQGGEYRIPAWGNSPDGWGYTFAAPPALFVHTFFSPVERSSSIVECRRHDRRLSCLRHLYSRVRFAHRLQPVARGMSSLRDSNYVTHSTSLLSPISLARQLRPRKCPNCRRAIFEKTLGDRLIEN